MFRYAEDVPTVSYRLITQIGYTFGDVYIVLASKC